jgi:gas vesicle protein
MATDDQGGAASTVLLAFLSGAVLGAVAALLLAPQSGRESREQLRGYARRAEEGLREAADRAGETMDQAIEKGREFVKDKKSALTEAFEAGREAMKRERERLMGEKKA